MSTTSFSVTMFFIGWVTSNKSSTTCVKVLRVDVSKYRPEVYNSEKSKILKKIHKVALGKLLT